MGKQASANEIAAREAAYSNRAAVPEFQTYFDRWALRSKQALADLRGYLDVSYGPHPMQTLDLFPAKGEARALLMFIHGGYWRSLDKRDHTFVAPPLVDAGVSVAMINYALCPAVTMEDIARQVVQAGAWLYRNGGHFGSPYGSFYVAGHSAGGHLAAMTLAAQWPRYASDLPAKTVLGAMSVSGLYDLQPLVDTPFINVDLRLTPAAARKVSPALMPPATDAPLYVAVGGKEISGFQDQHRIIKNNWKRVIAEDIACPQDQHFSILETFADPRSDLFQATLRMMDLR